jgi:hypothetical protein
VTVNAAYQLRRLAHGGDVGGDIECVRDEQQRHDTVEHRGRECFLDIGGEALAGHAAELRAHRLHGCHQREGERHGPQHVQPELRSGLRIGGDAAGVVSSGSFGVPRLMG